VVDVRVKEEREPPPREEPDIPAPPLGVPPEPPSAAEGCLAWLWRLLALVARVLRPVLPKRVYWLLVVLMRRLRAALGAGPPPVDPTRPKNPVDRVVHPSPYGAKPPLGPPNLPHMEQLEQRMDAELAIPPAAPAARDVTFDFARAKRFFERPESEMPPASRPPPEKPELDFHQALGALSDYPELMRRLGLIVRLKIDRPASDPATIRVIPVWDGQPRDSDVCPRTRCELDGDRFVAAHRPGSDLSGGALALGGVGDGLLDDAAAFDVVQVDTDGAALKAILAAATLERAAQLEQENVKTLDRPDRETTPALRSGGLAIVRPDRAWHLHQHLVGAGAQKAPKPAASDGEPAELPKELFAEDLVRGYRVEVSMDGGDWLSLCSRVGTYDLVDDAGEYVKTALTHTDEGYLKGTSGTSEAGEDKRLYVHEVLARWTGWSLTVPRPGKTLENRVEGPPVPHEPYDRPKLPRSEPETEFRLVTRFAPAPHTLPRLRFGRSYRLRAVCVDLAGEPLVEPSSSLPSTETVTYRRFEPAPPAAPLALRPFWPGESLEQVALRSDWNRDSETYDLEEMGAAAPEAKAHRTRHLFPPKTSQQMAELHGKLEAAFRKDGVPGDPDAGYRIALRESGGFRDQKIIDVHTVDVDKPQATIPFGEPKLVTPLGGAPPDGEPPTAQDHQGAYVINRADKTLPTPYLPDPIVAGIALRGLPGLVDATSGDPLVVRQVRAGDDPAATEPLLEVPFDAEWPDLKAFRLRVAEQTGATAQPPHWDAGERLLTVFLPKAGHVEVRYSAYLLPERLDEHGVWDWLDGDDPSGSLRAQAESGAHWMISPARTLGLVHAVQRPVEPARFTDLAAERDQIGQTTAELRKGKLDIHVPSTGRIDVIGEWTEFLDDPVKGWREERRKSVACDLTVDDTWSTGMAFPPPAIRASHEFGDTRHRRVKYLVRATTSFREYLKTGLGSDDLIRDTDAGDEYEVSVLSSARPIAPAVLYAVPTFDWPSAPPAAGWAQHKQRRGGGGLRVYLDRPWYASGEGELLGVVLQTGGQEVPDDLRSRYGLDAIWAGAPRPQVEELEPHHFPNRADEDPDVSLAEPGAGKATVAGFTPEWDDKRQLWFCDIELEVEGLPWNYWPFVRLAFVRYQPESLPDAKVSRVVLGEFGQLAPERTLSLAWQDDQHVKATLRGRAPAAPRAPRVAFRVQTTAVPAGQAPGELDWDHAAGHAPAIDWQSFPMLVQPDDPDLDGMAVWETVVELPAARGTQRMRLEAAEYESLGSDSEFGRGLPRITYAAHVPLD
jgi:hypothetical protein